jgi:hypothetical protein
MSVDAVALVSRLANARWRSLLLPMLDPDLSVRNSGLKELEAAIKASARGSTDLNIGPDDLTRLVEIGMTVQFPPTWRTWASPAHDVLFRFVTIRHPWLATTIETHYAAANDSARLDAITILAAQRSEEALRLLGALIAQYGMPTKMYQRFFWELNASFEFADLLMPQLVLHAGRHMPAVMDFINVAHERGKLTPEKLVPALDVVEREASKLLPQTLRLQKRSAGTRWRYAEKYVPQSHLLGALLDLLAMIPGASIETLQKATALSDPRLLSVVVASLLKRGVEPPHDIVRAAAASSVVRAQFYRALAGLGRTDLFPSEYATFESFAASHMAGWLAYPSELGFEPEVLELEARLVGQTPEGERQWCLWRFNDADGKAFASVSGPYEIEPPIGPLAGGDVFSNFAEWSSATPEQHLESVLATLKEWRLARERSE